MNTRGEDNVCNVLFLCTGNSARSIIAEVLLNRAGQGRFRAFSAGSHPKGRVHPYALDLLQKLNFDVSGLRSKSWTDFAVSSAPRLDFVFTVCDDAAKEACPVWPGQPMTAHWGVPDPAAATGNEAEIRLAFADTFRMLSNRINIFVSLPIRSLDGRGCATWRARSWCCQAGGMPPRRTGSASGARSLAKVRGAQGRCAAARWKSASALRTAG